MERSSSMNLPYVPSGAQIASCGPILPIRDEVHERRRAREGRTCAGLSAWRREREEHPARATERALKLLVARHLGDEAIALLGGAVVLEEEFDSSAGLLPAAEPVRPSRGDLAVPADPAPFGAPLGEPAAGARAGPRIVTTRTASVNGVSVGRARAMWAAKRRGGHRPGPRMTGPSTSRPRPVRAREHRVNASGQDLYHRHDDAHVGPAEKPGDLPASRSPKLKDPRREPTRTVLGHGADAGAKPTLERKRAAGPDTGRPVKRTWPGTERNQPNFVSKRPPAEVRTAASCERGGSWPPRPPPLTHPRREVVNSDPKFIRATSGATAFPGLLTGQVATIALDDFPAWGGALHAVVPIKTSPAAPTRP